MDNPFLYADEIRFGHEEAVRMHALGLGDAARRFETPRTDPMELFRWQESVEVGTPGEAHWTSSGNHYVGRCYVIKVNPKSFRVRLTENVPTGGGGYYLIGQELRLERVASWTRWSWSNTLLPPRKED